MSHYIVHEFRDQRLRTDLRCEAGPDADCRQLPDCDCEFYAIERAADGTAFHRVETYGGPAVLHFMKPGGPCNYEAWINESGIQEELTARGTTYTAAEIPVSVKWTGDDWVWEPLPTELDPRVERLARALFSDDYGEDWDAHERNCNLGADCEAKPLALRDATRYIRIIDGKETP